jgi:uncharacterized protein
MKKIVRSIAFSGLMAAFVYSFFLGVASANVEIPTYSPNVVDPNGHLTTVEKEEVNRAIDGIQSRGAMKPAVYLLSSLGGESIESLAEKAFRKWQLGEKGKDNGLLLVLAMEDRQMRIETGYGLEGNLPDLAARRILDEVLRPKLREGKVHAGIMATLQAVESVHGQGLDAVLGSPSSENSEAMAPWGFTRENAQRGLRWWGGLVLLLFLVYPYFVYITGRKKQNLLVEAPDLVGRLIVKANEKSLRTALLSGLPIRLFLAVNPGVFIFIFAALGLIRPMFDYVALVLVPLIVLLIYHLMMRRYASVAIVKAALAEEDRLREEKMKRLVQIGHAVVDEYGKYTFTEAYHESERKRIALSSRSSSSGSPSSSRSSSSGGGRSGGGGASSRW